MVKKEQGQDDYFRILTNNIVVKAGSQYDTGSASTVSITNVAGECIFSLVKFNF